jgi:hypothetical protein
MICENCASVMTVAYKRIGMQGGKVKLFQCACGNSVKAASVGYYEHKNKQQFEAAMEEQTTNLYNG